MSRPMPARVDPREIRESVREMIVALHSDLDNRVFKNRSRNFSEETELPAAIVYTKTQTFGSQFANTAPRKYERNLELVIELVAVRAAPADGNVDLSGQDDDLVDDYLDGLALEIEKRLERDPTLQGKVDDCVHTRRDYEHADNGKFRIGVLIMTETVTWYTEAPEGPESGFPPLRSIELTTRSRKGGDTQTLDRVQLRP